MGKITVGLTPHRLEFLPESLKLMEEHELVVLEEPPHPKFKDLLEGRVPIENFVRESESGFPAYALELYRALKDLYARGKKILQVEPYLERWVKIQEALAEGRKPEELKRDPELSPVYLHEHETFGRLLEFYGAMKTSFEELVERIKAFARADARRIDFRDRLRAQAILEILKTSSKASLYIEAGYIHLKLVYYLARGKPSSCRLEVRNLILSAVKAEGLKGLWPSPGDGLTSYYLFGKHRPIDENLLAARSLIYIRLIEKEELKPTEEEPFPHLTDELFWRAFVNELSYEECRRLDAEIRLLTTSAARMVARDLYPQIWDKARSYENLCRNLRKQSRA